MALPSSIHVVGDSWSLVGLGEFGPPTQNGQAQFNAFVTPAWKVELKCLVITKVGSSAWREWEAWVAERRGRVIADSIIPQRLRALWGNGTVPFVGGHYFIGGIGFTGLPQNRVSVAANQFARQVWVTGDLSWFVPGKFFWIGNQMVRMVSRSGSLIKFAPGLRQAAEGRTEVDGWGSIDMILTEVDDGGLERGPSGATEITLTMVERM